MADNKDFNKAEKIEKVEEGTLEQVAGGMWVNRSAAICPRCGMRFYGASGVEQLRRHNCSKESEE